MTTGSTAAELAAAFEATPMHDGHQPPNEITVILAAKR